MNRENIMATIADLKTELLNIETTKRQIESSLDTLTQLLRSPLLANSKRSPSIRSTGKKIATEETPSLSAGGGVGTVLASDRVNAVLDNISGRFTRTELYKMAAGDGKGPIAPGTFANIFSKLIKRNKVICVEGAFGKRDSVYMKSDRNQAPSEPSTVVQSLFTEEEKGE